MFVYLFYLFIFLHNKLNTVVVVVVTLLDTFRAIGAGKNSMYTLQSG